MFGCAYVFVNWASFAVKYLARKICPKNKHTMKFISFQLELNLFINFIFSINENVEKKFLIINSINLKLSKICCN